MSSRTRSLITIYLIIFLDTFGFSFLFALLPVLLLEPKFGLLPPGLTHFSSNFHLMLALLGYPLSRIFGAPFFGEFADRVGRKKALTWTLTGTMIGHTFSAFACLFNQYSLLILSRLLTGFFAANLALSLAILADLHCQRKKRTRSFGYSAGFMGGSWVAAFGLSAWLIFTGNLEKLHYSTPFWILALLMGVGLLACKFGYRDTTPIPLNHHRPLKPKRLISFALILDMAQVRTLLVVLFLWFLAFFLSLEWLAPLARRVFEAPTPNIFLALIGIGILWTLSAFFLPSIFNRLSFSFWKVLLWALFLTGLLYFFTAGSGFLAYLEITFALSGIFAALAWVYSNSLISFSVSPYQQGKGLGLALSVQSLSQFWSPLLGGVMAGFHEELVFYTASCLVLVAFLLLIVYVLKRKKWDFLFKN